MRSFNPCSLGCCSERRRYSVSSSTGSRRSFNPCSLGCCSESTLSWPNGGAITCFNPCSLGCCSESICTQHLRIHLIVSILVLLDVALKEAAPGTPPNRGVVSILVLLDVALKDVRHVGRVVKTPSFNPCSLGCCSESLPDPVFGARDVSFNPCSLGCCSERRRRPLHTEVRPWFQSLFSWMLLWK